MSHATRIPYYHASNVNAATCTWVATGVILGSWECTQLVTESLSPWEVYSQHDRRGCFKEGGDDEEEVAGGPKKTECEKVHAPI